MPPVSSCLLLGRTHAVSVSIWCLDRTLQSLAAKQSGDGEPGSSEQEGCRFRNRFRWRDVKRSRNDGSAVLIGGGEFVVFNEIRCALRIRRDRSQSREISGSRVQGHRRGEKEFMQEKIVAISRTLIAERRCRQRYVGEEQSAGIGSLEKGKHDVFGHVPGLHNKAPTAQS